jgi:hypothetical protein
MATQNLALVGVANNTAALVTYTHRACDGNNVQYVGTNASDSLAAPRIIDVKLDVKAPGVTGNDRATVSIKRTVLDTDNLPHTGSATIGLSIPRVSQWTQEETVSLLKQIADYLAGVSATVSGQTDTSGFPAKWAEMLIP